MKPITPVALGLLFTVIEFITGVITITLFVPDTPLDEIWRYSANAHSDMMLLRPLSTIAFFITTVALGVATAGCFMRKRWGWVLSVGLFALFALSNAVSAAQGPTAEGGVSVLVSIAVLWWLTRANVRALFT